MNHVTPMNRPLVFLSSIFVVVVKVSVSMSEFWLLYLIWLLNTFET